MCETVYILCLELCFCALNTVSYSLLMRLQFWVWRPPMSLIPCLTSVSANWSVTESPMCHLTEYWPLIGHQLRVPASDWLIPPTASLPMCLYPVSATVKAIKDRVVIRDARPQIMWYSLTQGARPKDTDYILILHIFRICSAALIFALLHNSLLGFCQQLLELSWGEGSEPTLKYPNPIPLALSTCHIDTDPGRCKRSSLTIRFPKRVRTYWLTNQWMSVYDRHYLYNYIELKALKHLIMIK